MQAQAVKHANRNELVFAISRRMAGVLEVMTVHGPNRASRQFGKCAEPVTRLQKAVEKLVRAGRDLRHHGAPPCGMERVEPGGAGERFTAILAALEKIASLIAMQKHAQPTFAQKLFVAVYRRVPRVSAVIPPQPECRL
jgi:hypothetical protein